MTGDTGTSVQEQVTIMILTTIVEFGCAFACMALLALGWIEAADGVLEPRVAVALCFSFGLILWAGYGAMMLVCRPTRIGLITVIMRAFAALMPLFLLWI